MGNRVLCNQVQNSPFQIQIQEQSFYKWLRSVKDLGSDRVEVAFQSIKKEGYYIYQQPNRGVMFQKSMGYYQGQLKNGEADGYGQLVLLNKSKYQGYFKNNKFSGQGQLKSKQQSFNGTWKQGFPVSGVLTCYGKRIDIKNMKKNGIKYVATVRYPDGTIYEGELAYKYNVHSFLTFEGKGKITFTNKQVYQGDWVDGRMEGSGRYQLENGDYYQGEYKNNCRNGLGTMFWKKQNKIYTGIWMNGKPSHRSIVRLTNQ